MNDLAEVLREQAAASRPRPDLDAVLRRAHAKRRRTVAAGALVAVALLAAVGIGFAASQGSPAHVTAARAPKQLPGLLVDGPPIHALDRRDATAAQGPATVVLRRGDGSLGRHSAVVTFPVPALTSGTAVTVDGASGRLDGDQLVWPVGGAYARVRGDLGDASLLAIARRTSVRGGRPDVRPPDGLAVVFTGPYRAPLVQEARYGSAKLGEGGPLGDGLAYTGVVRAGGFEDRLYAAHARTGFRVKGRPAVLSDVQGGNGTLAWEIEPGVVAYVGYSGNTLTDQAAQALTRLADRSTLVSATTWNASNPGVSEQTNGFESS